MENVQLVNNKYPRPHNAEFMKYGTAGFRDNASKLGHIMPRMGALAVLISLMNQGELVGLMITASHNPGPDNGVKLVNFDGSMIDKSIEAIAVKLGNSEYFEHEYEQLLIEYGASLGLNDPILKSCNVVVGRDTRESSARFSVSASEMIQAVGANFVDLGVVSTPMLHFAVWYNYKQRELGSGDRYYEYFEQRLLECVSIRPTTPSTLLFDGACGVGATCVMPFVRTLKYLNVDMEIRNSPSDGQLNHLCGSDYVQTSQSAPQGFTNAQETRSCSVDGDADRIVYHFSAANGDFHLIDGDKIAVLYLKVITEFLKSMQCDKPARKQLTIGCVQTAYANGASTLALNAIIKESESIEAFSDVQIKVDCAKTGVKNLHHLAENYDIGIYFEANGHGTVIFKVDQLEDWAHERNSRNEPAYKQLLSYLNLFNASVGDAFTDMLACEAGLIILNISVAQWAAFYAGLPCSQTKVYLPKDKMSQIIPHPEHERWLVSPTSVQEIIDATTKPYMNCRAFVRPSGTEPLVRLYVEAQERTEMELVVKKLTEMLETEFA